MSSFAYDCDLAGIHSVEAGAGSGKTYNIQVLVLRQLLKMQNPDIRRILVVTFTRKATAELRDRLRKVLALMLRKMVGAYDLPSVLWLAARTIVATLIAGAVALLLARALPVGAGMLAGLIRLVVCGSVGCIGGGALEIIDHRQYLL